HGSPVAPRVPDPPLLPPGMKTLDLGIVSRAVRGFAVQTPSGDDVVAGLLLALDRWRPVLWPGGDLGRLNALVVEAAYKATTTLSANLIECAAQGESDERLVTALDSIVTGQPAASECAPLLLGWGNSSGADALVGMTLALTALST
ncbi:MAG: DUF2877 domain-containing protein, partial [Chloroflexota bacterium]